MFLRSTAALREIASTQQRHARFKAFCWLAALAGLQGVACNKSCPKGLSNVGGQCVVVSGSAPDAGNSGVPSAAEQDAVLAAAPDAGVPPQTQRPAVIDAGQRVSMMTMTMAGTEAVDEGPEPMATSDGGARNCLVGVTRCNATGTAVEVCTVDDEWMPKESCSSLCKDGACAGECPPAAKHCGANQTVETCSPQGAWTPGETCAFVCIGDGECTGDCSPGSKQCGGPDGRTVQTCDESGAWIDANTCSSVCAMGSCSGSCVPGARRCRTALAPEICSDTGYWEPQDDCPFLCSDGQCTGECRPGSKLCDDQTPTLCDPAGHWAQDIPCVNSACVNGVCGGACTPDESRCGPNQTPQLCSNTGQWEPQRACQFVCSGDGECTGTCSPKTKICSGTTLRTCRADGSDYTDMTCQPAQANETAACSGNACVSRCLSPALKCPNSTLCWKLQYGCEQCVPPYVWREATKSDKTCVSTATRTRTRNENNNAMYPIATPCPEGLVPRAATADDERCVPEEVRALVKKENAMAAELTVVSTGVQP